MNHSDKKKIQKFERDVYIRQLIENCDQEGIHGELVKKIETLEKIINRQREVTQQILSLKTEEDIKINQEGCSKTIQIKVSKLLPYHNCYEMKIDPRGKKHFYFTPEYNLYKEEIEAQLEKNIEYLKDYIPRKTEDIKKLKLKICFYVNYEQKDLDNIMKPFIDILFRYLGDRKEYDDSQLWSIECVKRKTSMTDFCKERIFFEFEKMTETKLEESDLVHKFNDWVEGLED